MYLQHCVKGIGGISEADASDVIDSQSGIPSNWWRKKGTITPEMAAAVLTDHNLHRHLHDYATFGPETPFISLACGSVERDTAVQNNFIYAAIDTALLFATEDWGRPGALFYCWVPAAFERVVEVRTVAESVRDLNIYRRWSPYQLEGEITAKVHIPSNQIERVEWWNGSRDKMAPIWTARNPDFVDPSRLSNIRNLF